MTDSSTLTITLSQAPTIAIAKSANITTYSAPNTAVTYSYLVTNAGNVTLHSVTVADPMAGLSAVSCPDSTLAPGTSETCSATYTTTQTDVDRASITNTGTASGDPPSGPTVTDSATLVIPGAQSPGITMVKSANIASFSAPATTVTYSYLVTNTGNVTLTSVHVDDAMPNLSPISCSIAPLAPAASTTCTATYTTTQADVDRGSISNTATATGTAPLGPPPISGPSSVTIPATQTPGITIKKAGNPSGFSAAGSTIDYSYVVTNTGNVTLNPVTVNDPLPGLSPISCPSTQLAPDGLMTCTASYTTTQADVDAGGVTNTGTATGVPPAGPPVTDSATITIPASQQPNISLTKTASLTTYSAAGTPVTYDYQVTNTGNVTLDPVTVTDPMPGLSAITCSTNVLAPGGAETCTATYTTTQADMDHGSITNTGTASGTPPTGAAVVATSSVTLSALPTPAITLQKSASISSFDTAMTPITYSYLVTNTGNVTLDPVTVTDPMPNLSAVTCPDDSLAPSGSETCTATYTTVQVDVDRGSVANTGTAHGTPPTGAEVTATSSVTIPAAAVPAISILKSASPTSFSAPGTQITYTYQVTNTGNVTLSGVLVTDPMPGLSPIDSCTSTTLAPGSPGVPPGTETCTATYTTTQADVDRGSISNTATASGLPPTGPAVSDQSSATVTAVQSPSISMMKSASAQSFAAPGTSITYTYLVTNTGNVTLDPVTVTDPMPNLSAVTCPDPALAPAAFESCTATYVTSQADVDAGGVSNMGTAHGTLPSGSAVTATSSVTVPATQTPGISVTKSASPNTFAAPGTLLTYSYLAQNVGNVSLTSVAMVDPMPGLSAINCNGASTLAPGASETCTATYTTTQADVDVGHLTNSATATADPHRTASQRRRHVDGRCCPDPDHLHHQDGQHPDVLGARGRNDLQLPGDQHRQRHLEPGDRDRPDVRAVGHRVPLHAARARAGGTCTATYTTTQADVDRGSITNTGTATGTAPAGTQVTDTSSVTIPAAQTPSITLAKSASVADFAAAGTLITYRYQVTNGGNVTLDPVVVTDPMPNLSPVSCPDSSLAPGGVETCTATYTTSQTDVNAGGVSNVGTATGTPLTGPAVVDSATLGVPAIASPAITIAKSADPTSFSQVGTTITYTYDVTNAGNVTLDPVVVTDPMPNLSPVSCPDTSLDPLASEQCHATYVTTQGDLDSDGVSNTGTATGTPPTGPPVTDSSTLTVPAHQTPAIGLSKTADPTSFAQAGTVIMYTYQVTNTGDVTLNQLQVTDPMPHLSGPSCPDLTPTTPLDPGDEITCTGTYTTTQADVDAGRVTNTATAQGATPEGETVDDSAQATVQANQTPAIALTKSPSPPDFSKPGTTITYRYGVTNTGNVTLDPVTVTDPMVGLSRITCPVSSLAPAGTETCSATYLTTQADVQVGQITNTGTATGDPPADPPVTASAHAIVLAGAIQLVKSASLTTYNAPGQRVIYSYKVTNTGRVPLTHVTVADRMTGLSPISCNGVSTLALGASVTCTAQYTTTQADVDRGSLSNTATASGTLPAGSTVTSTSTATIPDDMNPAITLVKTASVSSVSTAGTVVTYSFKVSNSGNVTLNHVSVTDPMAGLSPVTCPAATLAPAASMICTATYTVTSADLVKSELTNTATATAGDPAGSTVQSTSATVTIPVTSKTPTPTPPPAPPSPVTPETLPVTG